MIRHTVVFTCKPNTPQQTILDAIENAHKVLPGIPGVRSFSMGRDLGLQPGKSGDFAVVADFDCIENIEAYLSDPVHLDYIKTSLSSIIETRISVQFEV
ncbi:MAG: Dabb family protein [Actinomycetota bacterium]|nr:Dabb family protein [Actinomycetota bacterium]